MSPRSRRRDLHPSREDVADSPLERASYGDLEDVGEAEISDAGAANLDEAPPADDLRRPLDLATGIGSLERPKRRSAGPFLLLLAVLAAGVAAVILYRGRGVSTPPAALAETPTPVVTASGELAVLSSEISPLPTEAPTPPAASTPRIEPTRPALLPTAAAAEAHRFGRKGRGAIPETDGAGPEAHAPRSAHRAGRNGRFRPPTGKRGWTARHAICSEPRPTASPNSRFSSSWPARFPPWWTPGSTTGRLGPCGS